MSLRISQRNILNSASFISADFHQYLAICTLSSFRNISSLNKRDSLINDPAYACKFSY